MPRPHFELQVQAHFSAAHHLRGYTGNCSRVHGHNWFATVTVRSDEVDERGIVVDFKAIKERLNSVLAQLDHSDLNDHPTFAKANPSTELLAQYIYRQVGQSLIGLPVEVAKVHLQETPSYGVTYSEVE